MKSIVSQACFLIMLITTLFLWNSCSGEEDGSDLPIDPDMVGTWMGTIDGSPGPADLTMNLKADASVAAEGSTSYYCPMQGTWSIIGTQFNVNGIADCDSTTVVFTAPYASGSHKLAGTWSTDSGSDGTFSVTKQ